MGHIKHYFTFIFIKDLILIVTTGQNNLSPIAHKITFRNITPHCNK